MGLWGIVCQLSDHAIFGCRVLKGDSPMVPGHESVGDVVAVGQGEQIWRVGDRAGGGWHGGHDRATTNKCFGISRLLLTRTTLETCDFCQRGLFQMCEQAAINGVTRYGGCMLFPSFPIPSPLTLKPLDNPTPIPRDYPYLQR